MYFGQDLRGACQRLEVVMQIDPKLEFEAPTQLSVSKISAVKLAGVGEKGSTSISKALHLAEFGFPLRLLTSLGLPVFFWETGELTMIKGTGCSCSVWQVFSFLKNMLHPLETNSRHLPEGLPKRITGNVSLSLDKEHTFSQGCQCKTSRTPSVGNQCTVGRLGVFFVGFQ